MSIFDKPKVIPLTSTDNPFINLVLYASQHHTPLDERFKQLFVNFLNNGLHASYDLNEEFYYRDNKNTVYKTNIFYLLSLLDNSDLMYGKKYESFYNYLFSSGMDIKSSTKAFSIEPITLARLDLNDINWTENLTFQEEKHSVFGRMDLEENKSLFFLKHLYDIMPFTDYEENIKKYMTLQYAAQHRHDNIIKLLVQQKIDINLVDPNLKNSLFYTTNKSTLETLNSLNINWLQKDIDQQDALSVFSGFSDKEKKDFFCSLAQTRMTEQAISGEYATVSEDGDYMKQRLRTNLVEMVTKDSTKGELDKFIKKHKIDNLDTLNDKSGNNLLMICLNNNNWARANLFLTPHALEYFNDNLESAASILFQKTRVTAHKDTAIDLMNQSIKTQLNNKNYNLGFSLMIKTLSSEATPFLPLWWLKHDNIYQVLNKLNFTLDEKNKWSDIVNKIDLNKYNNFSIDNNCDEYTRIAFDFYHTLMKKQNLNFSFNQINPAVLNNSVKAIFSHHDFQKRPHYSINQPAFFNYQEFSTILSEYNSDLKDSYDTMFLNAAQQYLLKGYKEHKKPYLDDEYLAEEQHLNDFCQNNSILLQFLLNQQHYDFVNQLPYDIRANECYSEDLKKHLHYSHLTMNLPVKDSVIQHKKHKI